MAADYADFCEVYPLEDSVVAVDSHMAAEFFTQVFERKWEQQNPQMAKSFSSGQKYAAALDLLRESWKIPYNDFAGISFLNEMHAPLWQQAWFPANDPRARAYLEIKEAARNLQFTPGAEARWQRFAREHGVRGAPPLGPGDPATAEVWHQFRRELAPASPVVPYAARTNWLAYLQSNAVHDALGLARSEAFDLAHYNQLAGTAYEDWSQIPFPLPSAAPAALQNLWSPFAARYPLRLTSITVTPELTASFQNFLQARFKTIQTADLLLNSPAAKWSDFALSPTAPQAGDSKAMLSAWIDFIRDAARYQPAVSLVREFLPGVHPCPVQQSRRAQPGMGNALHGDRGSLPTFRASVRDHVS